MSIQYAALLALGIAFGALLHSWRMPAGEASATAVANDETHDEHGSEGTGIVQIPVEAQKAGGIETEQAVTRAIESSIQVTGIVSADQGRVARIRPLARGLIETVFVQQGDRVQKGDPLVSYDNIELGLAIGEFLSANADLRSRHATLEAQETILSRSRQMLEVGAIARTEHEIRTARYNDARAQVNAEQARVAQFEEQLHRFGLTEEDIERLHEEEDTGFHRTASITTLRAPSQGLVTSIEVRSGETVDGSSPLLTLTDISRVWVLADIFEHDLGSIPLGNSVSVRVPAYPETIFRGRITYISDVLELETRAARVRCVVENPGALLKLGMFATVEIRGGRSVESLAVPASAIQNVNGHPVVFIKRSDSTFELSEVETGVEADGWMEIRDGLSAGDTVITGGSFYAKTATLRELIGHSH